jgi:hypothetical protein
MDEKLVSTYAQAHLERTASGKRSFLKTRLFRVLSLLILSLLIVTVIDACASTPVDGAPKCQHHFHEHSRL